jgi:hypothetical protein
MSKCECQSDEGKDRNTTEKCRGSISSCCSGRNRNNSKESSSIAGPVAASAKCKWISWIIIWNYKINKAAIILVCCAVKVATKIVMQDVGIPSNQFNFYSGEK